MPAQPKLVKTEVIAWPDPVVENLLRIKPPAEVLEVTAQPKAEIITEVVAEPADDAPPERVSEVQAPIIKAAVPAARAERLAITIPEPPVVRPAPVFKPKTSQPTRARITPVEVPPQAPPTEPKTEAATETVPEPAAPITPVLDRQPDITASVAASALTEHDPEPPIYSLELAEFQFQFEPAAELEGSTDMVETEVVEVEPVDIYEIFVQDEVVWLQAEIGADQPLPEAVPDIDEVLLAANDQPLEETSIQLSLRLESLVEAGVAPEDQSPADEAIHDALKDVIDLLPPQEDELAIDQESPEPIELTPELAEKLVILLQAVGYDNPEQVLADFIEEKGAARLVQHVRGLYRRYDDSRQAEFDSVLRGSSRLIATDSHSSLTSRLGRAMLRYFFLGVPALQGHGF